MNIKESFERVGFTPEEKMDLTARLERAAELEENMTSATKRKIKRISGGMIFGVAAAAIMTVGALAAVISPGLRSWFDTTTPGASSALEDGIYRLDRSETYNGWTVTLDECVGDDSSLYIWVDITAPEGTVLAPQEDGYFHIVYDIPGKGGANMTQLPDEDPTDNKISCLIQHNAQNENGGLRGETVSIQINPIVDRWWTDRLTERAQLHEGSELTAAIRDHQWVFEDVKLDFPDQTVRLAPNVAVPWLNGTTTVTGLEVSPLSVRVELEGGTCADYVAHANSDPMEYDEVEEKTVVKNDGLVIEMGPADEATGVDWWQKLFEMERTMTVEVVLQDGTRLVPTTAVRSDEGYREGREGAQTPWLAWSRRYDDTLSASVTRVLDPAQVDHVTVCGVDIPLDPSAAPASKPAPVPAVPDSSDAPQEAASAVGTVTAGKGLNVRSGPGTQHKVVDSLRKGAEVTILGETSGFYQVDYAGGKTGYVSKSYVTVK